MKIVTVSLRHQRISPQKVRLVLDVIRGANPNEAISYLNSANKKAARILSGLVKSGISACKSKDYKEEELYISEAVCQEGKKLKRTMVSARGRSRGYLKRMSHVKLSFSKNEKVLSDKKEDKKTTQSRTNMKQEKSNGTKS